MNHSIQRVAGTSAGVTGVPQDRPQTDIESEVSRLTASVENVWQSVNQLNIQLSSALRSEADERCSTEKPEPITTCQLGDQLRKVTYRAEEAQRFLDNIRGRLAL